MACTLTRSSDSSRQTPASAPGLLARRRDSSIRIMRKRVSDWGLGAGSWGLGAGGWDREPGAASWGFRSLESNEERLVGPDVPEKPAGGRLTRPPATPQDSSDVTRGP